MGRCDVSVLVIVNDVNPTIDYYRKSYSGELSPADLNFKLYTYANNAKRTFDPSKKASFKTHLNSHLSKIMRDVHETASPFKVSEEVGLNINRVRKAKDEFYMMNGTDPTPAEIATTTGLSKKIVNKYSRMSRIHPVKVLDGNFGMETFDVKSMLPDLKGKEKLVGESISMDMNTSKALKHTGLSKSKYYRTRSSLRDKMKASFLRTQGQSI